ncbi:MAG: QueT transporter family protein [Oscillospiraceae bacterium]|nr:QueT transporter family protein [Oscillospiraceae bacterium]
MRKFSVRDLVLAAAIAAVYAVLTLALPIPQYGGVQLRVAEALTVLPFLFPAAIPGLTVGCFLANLLGSPFPADWIFGTLATLLAAVWTSRLENRWLAPLPPVICNAAIVGAEIALFFTEGEAFWPAYAWNAFTVGLGELIACYVLGTLLIKALGGVSFLKPVMRQTMAREPSV